MSWGARHPHLDITYSFESPEGTLEGRASKLLTVFMPKETIPTGTPIFVIYKDKSLHRLL